MTQQAVTRAEQRRQRVLAHLQDHPGSWISAPGITRALGYRSGAAGHIREDLAVLLERGQVTARPAGHDGGREWSASDLTTG